MAQVRFGSLICVALISAIVSAGGCSPDDELVVSPNSSPTAVTSSTTTLPSTSTNQSDPSSTNSPTSTSLLTVGAPASTPVSSVNQQEGPLPFLVDTRLGLQGASERVIFELNGRVPSFVVRLADGPIIPASGAKPVDPDGPAGIEVCIDNLDLGKSQFPEGSLPGSGDIVTEVVLADTFEGRATYLIGTVSSPAFAVDALSEPDRLVIDIVLR